MNKDRRDTTRGFTLAELLVATLLMSIVLTGAYTMFHTVILQWRSGSANESTYRDARLIFSLMERDLQGIPTDETSYDARAFFVGDEQSLDFITLIEPMPSDESMHPRLMRVTYRLDKRRLIREESELESLLPIADSETGRFDRDLMRFSRPREQIISAGVLGCAFVYLWSPVEEDGGNDLFQASQTRYQLSNGIRISLRIVDPAKSDVGYANEFSKTVRLLGTASERPETATRLLGTASERPETATRFQDVRASL